jgi:hypothetical protein
MRCPKCYLSMEVGPGETPESLAAECGIGHHTDTIDGCPGFPDSTRDGFHAREMAQAPEPHLSPKDYIGVPDPPWPDVPAQAPEPPEIVVLCGSTKFPEAFAEASKRLGLAGIIVLSVSMFGHAGDLTDEECTIGHPVKDGLDELHKRKIDLADRVLVLNVGGYIGDSTRSEIEYAERHNKPIDYLEAVHA